jgi:prephenate dehydratase
MPETRIVPDTPPPDAPRVAFQGVPGAFSELAIQQRWPAGALPVPCDTFVDTVDALFDGRADFAAIPVENAIAGPVLPAQSALANADARIQHLGETQVLIRLCLMALPGATLANLRRVLSHAMALGQSTKFFSQHEWLAPEVYFDTAGAARDVAAGGDRTVGAIASSAAAERYQLDILARNVEDVPDNWTRFVIVSARESTR